MFEGEIVYWDFNHLSLILRDVIKNESKRIPVVLIRGSNINRVEFSENFLDDRPKGKMNNIQNKLKSEGFETWFSDSDVMAKKEDSRFKIEPDGTIHHSEDVKDEFRKTVKDAINELTL